MRALQENERVTITWDDALMLRALMYSGNGWRSSLANRLKTSGMLGWLGLDSRAALVDALVERRAYWLKNRERRDPRALARALGFAIGERASIAREFPIDLAPFSRLDALE